MNASQPPVKVEFRWHFNWKICVFSALLLPLLLTLGFWQLARAQQKAELAAVIAREQTRPAIDFAQYRQTDQDATFNYRAVSVYGVFDAEHYWLLENKTRNGQLGFEVVMPFTSRAGDTLLVNRGWLAGSGYRDRLPQVPVPAGPLAITGWLTTPSDNPLIDEQGREHTGWPRLALEMDIDLASAALDLPLAPQWLKLRAESPGALAVDWQPIAVPAARHQGYAVQWFAMAAMLLLLTLVANSNIVQWIKSPHE